MDKQRIQYLHDQYRRDALSAKERQEWQGILSDPHAEPILRELLYRTWDNMADADKIRLKENQSEIIYQRIVRRSQPHPSKGKRISLWPQIAAVASIVLVAAFGLWYYQQQQADQPDPATAYENILPGGNKATLTLADGRSIDLSETQTGIIIGEQITYLDGSSVAAGDPSQQLLLTTPKGGTYQVRLPDGTTVWLNAASRLSYPARFQGQKERRVRLQGEGYFEVAKDKEHPFIVVGNDQEVTVLGTQFNVQAYDGEKTVRTTLVEGSVKVMTQKGTSIQLRPGEQAVWDHEAIAKSPVDVEAAIAWKEGYFKFDGDLQSIMGQISRWYDVDVVFEKGVDTRLELMGRISRDKKLGDILRMLGEIDPRLTFKVEERRLIVMP